MKFINKGRGTGKTLRLMIHAHITGTPILVYTERHKKYILECADRMNMDVTVFTISEFRKNGCCKFYDNVVIDELPLMLPKILDEYLNTNALAATLSLPME